MNTTEVALTELSDLDPDELHLVKRAATGFPALLAKSVAAEIEAAKSVPPPIEKPRKTKLPKYVRQQVEARRNLSRTQQESVMPKKSKSQKVAAKSLRKSLKKAATRRTLVGVVAKAERQALDRIAVLERTVKKAGGSQDSWGAAYELHRLQNSVAAYERVRKAPAPDINDFAALDNYMGNPNPAAAGAASSRAATARAVASAQGEHINQPRLRERDVLRGVLDGTGEAETLQTFEIQTRKLEKALTDATSPQERESLGYQVTRRKLLAMHMRGEG